MQPGFAASNKPALLQTFKKALSKAMEEGQYILVVNFEAGPMFSHLDTNGKKVIDSVGQRNERHQLHPDLQNILKDYPNKDLIWKRKDSGATAIINHLQSKDIFFSKLYITGVNSCACISATVQKLSQKNQGDFLIEVSTSCCSCTCSDNDLYPVDEICTKITTHNLQWYKNVITDIGNTPLKSALDKNDFSYGNEILSLYEQKVSKCIEDGCWENLIEIKRDLLLSLYFLKSRSNFRPKLHETLTQLLHEIQISLDENIPLSFIPTFVREEIAAAKEKEKPTLETNKNTSILAETQRSTNTYSWFNSGTVGAAMIVASAVLFASTL